MVKVLFMLNALLTFHVVCSPTEITPAIHRWDRQSSAVRTSRLMRFAFPAMNRWAIFIRPLRGLLVAERAD
ncbi:MAG TPA: hypothetical protein VEM96_08320 [Pyrinomonadaceae bacterium]|nr:hypothetical protein [Pyrinomonadaceae bacterium]